MAVRRGVHRRTQVLAGSAGIKPIEGGGRLGWNGAPKVMFLFLSVNYSCTGLKKTVVSRAPSHSWEAA